MACRGDVATMKPTMFILAALVAVAVIVVMIRPRVRQIEEPTVESTLYIHLNNDGKIMVLPGDHAESRWVSRDDLRRELQRFKEMGGTLLYSREAPDQDPSPIVFDTFQEILEYKLPIKLLTEPHPDAG